MWDKAVSFAAEKVVPLLLEAVKVLRGIPVEVADIKEELESVQVFINGADRMVAVAVAAEQENTRDGIKTKVKQLREAAFRIEDVIEDYMIITGEQQLRDPGCASITYDTDDFIKSTILRLRISYEIQDIKSRVREINPIQSNPSSDQGSASSSSTSTLSQNVTWHNLRMNTRYVEEGAIVGFEAPRKELITWLEEGRAERTVISVVGMGGQGKTTLAKTVYDEVIGKFHCHAWITVSKVYTTECLLRDMLNQFCEGKNKGISEMGGYSLIEEVRNYLLEKRYVIFFDDVSYINFWSEIEFAVLDNKKSSRILITTRKKEVAEYCKESSFVHIQNLQPLTPTKSWDLFCNNAFQNEPDGHCPDKLKDMSSEIVNKCNGLPLAIIAIGGLLATKEKKSFEWQRLHQTAISELEKNPNSTGITNILSFTYDDLPYYLKSCMLYFGIYHEDYEVECTTLIKQWIAEGFVKYEKEKTLEEVAEQYLKELIYRSLVQVSSFSIDGKAKRCRVHNLVHKMVLMKIEDLNFCHFGKHDESVFGGMVWRLKIATNSHNLVVTSEGEGSQIRSLYIFREEELREDFVRKIPTKYRGLKVLDFEHAPLSHVPQNLGNLYRLRYLSFRRTNVESLPKSIGLLQFLETLDLRQTRVRQMPKEINKLTKLRHLLANHHSWGFGNGIQMMEGVGGLVSLQTLRQVEADYRGEELIKELEKLRQLRLLGLIHVKREYGSTLCSSLKEMQHLEKLYIDAIGFDEVIDFHDVSPFPALQKLRLRGKLEKLPKCISELNNLIKLSLISSKLTDDPLESLKDMPNLLSLELYSAYEGERLDFLDGGFKKLKKLSLRHLYSLNFIFVGKGALQSLKEFMLEYISELIEVPSGIDNLGKLEVFNVINMPEVFRESVREEDWINKHVRQVNITDSIRRNYWDKQTRASRNSRW